LLEVLFLPKDMRYVEKILFLFESLEEFWSGDDGIKDPSHDFDSRVEAEQKLSLKVADAQHNSQASTLSCTNKLDHSIRRR
jgi:hypothetical protein